MTDNLTSLSVEWTDDASQLIRVIDTDSFKSGFVLTARVGEAAESIGYYPEVTLSPDKVVIEIAPDTDGRHYELARRIDELLPDAPDAD